MKGDQLRCVLSFHFDGFRYVWSLSNHFLPDSKKLNLGQIRCLYSDLGRNGSELGFGYNFLNNSYAAGLAGLAVGSVFFVPAALIFGRKAVYLFASITMVLVNSFRHRLNILPPDPGRASGVGQ